MSDPTPIAESRTRIKLQGFGLPLDVYQDDYHQILGFANALGYGGDAEVPMITLREFTMMQLMNDMTDKDAWHEKVINPEIAAKWKDEALNTPDLDLTEAMVDWCIAEVQHKARILKNTNSVIAYTGDVVKSDTIVPESVRLALIDAIRLLEEVPDRHKDWHPRSSEMVLDLVHPSLWPLVYGKTRVLPFGGTTLDDCIALSGAGETLGVPECSLDSIYNPDYEDSGDHRPYSLKFQWLPCEVDISNGQTRITSYINNLHPQHHKPLYEIIEQIISYAIPLWDITLSPQRSGYEHRIEYRQCEYDPPSPAQEEDEDQDEYWRKWEEWSETREVIQPDAGIFTPATDGPSDYSEDAWETGKDGKRYLKHRVDIRKEFGEGGIQVIVKLANIVLTPDKPEYGGGTWHVEGQLNEHICASAIYYYSSSNITTSRLSFRQRVSTDYHDIKVGYKQDEKEWLPEVFGLEDENGDPIQFIGSVDTRQGRLITFPNHLQHKVEQFRLEDSTQPGFRKILALFLVDPQTPIISTKNVPCQRLDWWSDLMRDRNVFAGRLATDRLSNLPPEVQEQIFDKVEGFPIAMEEAKELRLELMNERSIFVETQNGREAGARGGENTRSLKKMYLDKHQFER